MKRKKNYYYLVTVAFLTNHPIVHRLFGAPIEKGQAVVYTQSREHAIELVCREMERRKADPLSWQIESATRIPAKKGQALMDGWEKAE